MNQYVVSPPAEIDLLNIWLHIADKDVSAADRVWDRLFEIFEMLGRQPLIGEACDNFGRGLRNFPVGSHVVYYRPKDDGVVIYRVVHGARDAPAIFSEN